MFSFHNRQYIFRQADGEIWNFFCDPRQNLCYNTLTRRGVWSNAVALHKNVHRFFYAEMDQDSAFHLLFQDSGGNLFYSRLDGESIRTVPVLSSKTPSAYDKQLYIAPFKDVIYFFYVLQHENSFLFAYQALSGGRMSTPKVVDYVSGSNIPCSVIYDNQQNIYAFYQSYDGKYLQLGYKKFNTAQKHWSDFTPVTKYAGNCEYPHAIVDSSGIIHLCYQRRAPKIFEMVYQQKAPDRNLWSPEVVVHSSVHSFENASILQAKDKIVVYWVRDDVIYYNVGLISGINWVKPSRYGTQFGRQLLCLCYKSNSPRDGDVSQLSPGIYPGAFANGLKLAFINIGDASQLFAENYEGTGASAKEAGGLVADALVQLQGSVEEVRAGWTETRKEMSRLTNAYMDMKREMDKYSIRLNMLERQPGQAKRPGRRDAASRDTENRDTMGRTAAAADTPGNQPPDLTGKSSEYTARLPDLTGKSPEYTAPSPDLTAKPSVPEPAEPAAKPEKKPSPSLDPEKLKVWEEWKEPKEWQEGGD